MWAFLSLAAEARPTAWFRNGADDVRLAQPTVDVALLRGPTTGQLPSVLAKVPVDGEDRTALAVVDLAAGVSRVDPATARALGLVPVTDADGAWLELRDVRVGGLSFGRLRLRVEDGAPGLVLGLTALPELAAALLPSEGVVRFVDRADADALLSAVGTPIEADRHTDELAWRVPGALRFGPVVVDGPVHVRTDGFDSRLTPSERLPSPTQRGGAPHHDVGTRLAGVDLSDTWIRVDRTANPGSGLLGELGYDVLYALDLAVDPSTGRLALRVAPAQRVAPSTVVTVAAALERYELEERRAKGTADATGAPPDARATIGFDGPVVVSTGLGDAGNPVVRDRNLLLADTLWAAGQPADALPRYLSATQYAGDHCLAHLRLGERRLAWSGADRVDHELLARLVEDPLVRAARAWDAWVAASPATRAEIAAGRPPAGAPSVVQPEGCRIVWGLLYRVERTAGRDEPADRIAAAHDRDPSVVWGRVLEHLEGGRFGPADALLPRTEGGVGDEERVLTELRIAGGLAQVERAEQLARQVPGSGSDHPLTSALVVVEAARGTRAAADVVGRLVRSDPRWVPGRLAVALVDGTAPPPWSVELERQRPGDPLVACQQAAHLALSGRPDEARALLGQRPWTVHPDWWAASALTEHLAGDAAARDRALRELRLRFPWLPVGDLGLR